MTLFVAIIQVALVPLIVAVGLWASLSLALIQINRLGQQTGRWLLVLTIIAGALLHIPLLQVRADASNWGAYQGFAIGMVLWSAHELAFYSGVVTGPWRRACPPAITGWRRLGYALGTHLYHELLVGLTVLSLWWFHREAVNTMALFTFGLCWGLQHSAKLSVLFGVSYLPVQILPPHMAYLGSYWRPRAWHPVLLVALTSLSALTLWLWHAVGQVAPGGPTAGIALLAALASLGVIEHVLLLRPKPTDRQRQAAPNHA